MCESWNESFTDKKLLGQNLSFQLTQNLSFQLTQILAFQLKKIPASATCHISVYVFVLALSSPISKKRKKKRTTERTNGKEKKLELTELT